ncbi:MAG: L-threonylcarbamoyladenylate synthase [bacterium]|jgi:tRNA threonylcarbamoyl adenosine modification protein (Sua5/YciO/YrdC/YwlC family)|nr:threonylcarbamoyl-AMP synthase [Chitinophagaceae bacterium]
MLITVHPKDPQQRLINQIADCLRNGGVIIYPTDTVYGLGCDIFQPKAVERICRIKGIDPTKANLSFICSDLSDLSKYARAISTPQYRLIKNHIPGPFTFILPASKEVPKILKSKKDTIGLRVPDHNITHAIAAALGNPILSSSLPGDMVEEYTDPELIHDKFHKLVDIVVDGGIGRLEYSTIVDMTDEEPEVIRQGAGILG